ncbi:acrosin-like isoform X2 [Cuculus canorus]|uniref:acrosin-like isoform X2 n=1 Tax=Cuculus canorus TaxID=55661 RepID=UPI0023AA23C8|nr:acrosin-like isoform X2 [Cuculus canorus]
MNVLLLVLVLLALCGPVQGTWDTCETCGLRPLDYDGSGMTRVVGGRDAQAGAWPWIVSIQSPWEAGTGHICGGSLIGTQWVLTAAHCFTEAMNTEMWRVVAGATDLTQLGPEVQIRSIKQIFVHENYNNISQRNDIALLELDQPVQCSSHVQLACLPNATLKASQLTTCYVSGWGATHEEGGTSDVLQEAKVPLIDTHVCNSSGWYRGAIHTHNLCAGYPRGGIDTCQGDSGGPLVCKNRHSDHFWLVGVTSWGRGCARVRRPGIYTSTQHFLDWILVQMGLHPPEAAAPTAQPTPTGKASCPLPRRKMAKFVKILQDLLKAIKEIMA